MSKKDNTKLEDIARLIRYTIFHEALKAHEALKKEAIPIRVIDLYSVKTPDEKTLIQAAEDTRFVFTVEDHYPAGGLREALRSVLPRPSWLCGTDLLAFPVLRPTIVVVKNDLVLLRHGHKGIVLRAVFNLFL